MLVSVFNKRTFKFVCCDGGEAKRFINLHDEIFLKIKLDLLKSNDYKIAIVDLPDRTFYLINEV